MTPARFNARAFTLIEMLAATSMVALLAASLLTSLGIAFRARKTAMDTVAATRQFSRTLEIIKADLQSAMVPGGVLAGSFVGASGTTAFVEQGDSLIFYTTASDVESDAGVGDIKKIEYACVPSGDPGRAMLIRRVTANLLAPVQPDPNEETLCRNVKTFLLRYFDGSDWQENWDSSEHGNALPKAVGLNIQVQGASAQDVQGTSLILPMPCGQWADSNSSAAGASSAAGGL
jgi:prepilin-type N-terminal cleavage/methylation domain-containing protein